MKRNILLIVIALSVVAITIYLNYFRNIIICQNLLREYLVDPDSAKFYDVKYSETKGGICGYYNSRNRMGGYVGKKLFACEYKTPKIYIYNDDVVFLEYLLDEAMSVINDTNKFKEVIKKASSEEWDKIRENKTILNYCKQ